jgi:hypothetical protein
MNNIPIVIAAFNRLYSLERLLKSLDRSFYPENTKLIISIDGGGVDDVVALANSFEWKYGEKEVIKWPKHLGLRKHILCCGSLTKFYEGIILLEDDLFVAPYFYDYILSAYGFYKTEKKICGIALYSHTYNETACAPFTPINEASDTFFLQTACSWGQFWSNKHWEAFEEWYKQNKEIDVNDYRNLPGDVALWPDSSWKKFFIKYMMEKDKYFVFPRCSYSTNFGDVGEHHKGTNLWQVPLQYEKVNYDFIPLKDSYAKYDVFCEILPFCLKKLAPHLGNYEISVDLYGMKTISSLNSEYIVTSKECVDYIKSYGRKMKPHEVNIIECIEGNNIFFTKKSCVNKNFDFLRYRSKMLSDFQKNYFYFYQLTNNHIYGLRRTKGILDKVINHIKENRNELQSKNRVLYNRANDISGSCLYRVLNLAIRFFYFLRKIIKRKNS